MTTDREHALPAAPRVPPLAVTVIVVTLMWLATRLAPAMAYDFRGRRWLALALLAVAVVIGVAGVLGFRRARTTVNPLRPQQASTLVTSGVYQYTRNPMYLAIALALLGWGLWLGHWPALAGVALFVAWMDFGQIPAEERALAALFGEEFSHYRRQVRRWI